MRGSTPTSSAARSTTARCSCAACSSPTRSTRMVAGIDRAFAGATSGARPLRPTAPWFVPFVPSPKASRGALPRVGAQGRRRVGGGLAPGAVRDARGLTAESGSPTSSPATSASARRCRCASAPCGGSGRLAHADWHQDGAFLGDDVRSVNVWLALTDCGGDATRRVSTSCPGGSTTCVETGTEGAIFDWSVGPGVVDAGRPTIDAPIVPPAVRGRRRAAVRRPVPAPHRDRRPAMTSDRYAIESWFFAPSALPRRPDPARLLTVLAHRRPSS